MIDKYPPRLEATRYLAIIASYTQQQKHECSHSHSKVMIFKMN